ncbi:TIGR01777 family oxidoreductase [Acinetobacter wuhouensis]|uniref:TIGR01777 family protein n=1 Tax=Acinetobacter wuhouensis TaxID=1879050 RepID=A0A4Q7AKU2_9GAMM|nr:TIGR01777 family oxidoreductase [Acinetobacter wuhouensis]RZG46654.1 TIGR01777 family protein [Acinetobacter wuhouensis]RZG72411.1 TIGR01777 family protein [Acinetobacter wuhouensis]
MLKVLITGASGFIGTHLVDYLLQHGFEVIAYSRQKRHSQEAKLTWIENFTALENTHIDYVVNLAGESIAQSRWTAQRKQQLIDSRVQTTQQLYQALQDYQIQPRRIVSGSAIGYYGIDPTQQWQNECDENSSAQGIFMSELCQRWEAEALADTIQNTKIMRLGVVFGQKGALQQMLLPIKMGLIGRIGSGQQPTTWVHVDDVIQAILFLFQSTSDQKIYNVVAPDHIAQMQFVNIASKVLKRKPFLPLPSFVMRLLMGEQAQLVLNGQYVQPKALLAEGFDFQYANLESALRQITQHSPN